MRDELPRAGVQAKSLNVQKPELVKTLRGLGCVYRVARDDDHARGLQAHERTRDPLLRKVRAKQIEQLITAQRLGSSEHFVDDAPLRLGVVSTISRYDKPHFPGLLGLIRRCPPAG
ncbi:MAG TPA: hypothetical protein VLJ80_15625 [Solirubrobacteraceae bacterium]|nr:hypothetical protein [Solirubrobacteraceae bacterium]